MGNRHFTNLIVNIFYFSAVFIVGCSSQNIQSLIPVTPIALGQPDFTTNAAPGAVAANNFSTPEYKLHSDGTRLVVSDYMNSRVLIWNSMPTSFAQPADVVVGQPDMTTNTCNFGGSATAATLCRPGGVHLSGSKLFVVDYNNSRVLIWNSIPTSNFAPADVVLGQPDMTSTVGNNGGVSAISLDHPWALTVAGLKLFVSDYDNSRILIWNSIPTANRAPADVVLGQVNMTSNVDGSLAPSASSLSYPYDVMTDGTKLAVADTGNARTLIWNSIPTSDGAAASVVVGQADMTSVVWAPTPTAQSMEPSSVYLHGDKLYVLDLSSPRMLIWDTVPTTDNIAASRVFGQPDMVSSTANNGGVSQTSLGNAPEGLYVDNRRIIIGDPGNYRVLVLPKF